MTRIIDLAETQNTIMESSMISLPRPCTVVFKPHDDESFATTSHKCELVVHTLEGDWLFNLEKDD